MFKVSVIVCVYNEELCILHALKSLRQNDIYLQTEIIIIDDCSSNPVTRRLLYLLENFTLCKIAYSKNNLGLSNSRNIGFQSASTPYVLPLDADDKFPAGTLDNIYNAFVENPDFDFIAGNYYLKDAQNEVITTINCESISTANIIDIKKLADDWKLLGTSPCKKMAWQKINGYNLKYSYSVQDVDFWIRMLLSGAKGLYINQPVYIWNRSSSGMNMNFDRIDMIKLLEDHEQFYLINWTKGYLYNKIFEGFYPYKQIEKLMPLGKKYFFYLTAKNKIRLICLIFKFLSKRIAIISSNLFF